MRDELVAALVDDLGPSGLVDAIWEGGSKATGRLDAYSDVDLMMLARGAGTDAVFERVEAVLDARVRRRGTWTVGTPAFEGLAQRFYRFDGAPEFFFLDIGVFRAGTRDLLLEVERHGTPAVYFDPGGCLRPRHVERAAHRAAMRRRLDELQASLPVRRMLVEKEVRRAHPIDALAFYQALVRMLVEILGMQYRPFRYDFGARYLHDDLRPEAQQVEERRVAQSDDLPVGHFDPALILDEPDREHHTPGRPAIPDGHAASAPSMEKTST